MPIIVIDVEWITNGIVSVRLVLEYGAAETRMWSSAATIFGPNLPLAGV
jgi:hypothetical protein